MRNTCLLGFFLVLFLPSQDSYIANTPVLISSQPSLEHLLSIALPWSTFLHPTIKMCNTSPAKLLRSVKRISKFIEEYNQKCDRPRNLSICHQSSLSIAPKLAKLSVTSPSSISLPPCPLRKLNLNVSAATVTSIPPRPVYHPAIVKASLSLFNKHPRALSAAEIEKFNHYRNWKDMNGEHVEDDIVYLPAGGMRNCVNCGELTWLLLSLGFPSFTYNP